MSALRSGDARLVGRALSNDLQPAALSLFPALRKTLAAGLELGALGALVSGSGTDLRVPGGQRGPRPRPGRVAVRRGRVPVGGPGQRAGARRRHRLPGDGDRAAVNLISLEKAAKAYAHRTLLNGVSLGVSAGDRVGVVGRNGAGKSTLLALLAGRTAPDTGRVAMASGLRLGYLPQGDQLAGTVGEIVFGGWRVAGTPWEADPRARVDHGRAAARDRPGRAGRAAVRRRAAAGRARLPAGGRARRAAARRADQPPGHRGDRLARPAPARRAGGTARSSWSATTAGCWTPSASGPGRSTGARCIRPRAATRPTCSPRPSASAARKSPSAAAATWPARSSPGCSAGPGPGPPRRSSGWRRPTRSSRRSRRPGTAWS